jgi:hypothetical protein
LTVGAFFAICKSLCSPNSVIDGVITLCVADDKSVVSWNYERRGGQPLPPMFEATPTSWGTIS